MILQRPIKSLLSKDAAGQSITVQVSVVPMTAMLIRLWVQKVQPLIDASYQHAVSNVVAPQMIRADVGWNWRTILWLAYGHSTSAPAMKSGPAMAMCLVVQPSNGPAFPIGMLTAVPMLMSSVFTATRTRGFAWFLSDAPREVYTQVLKVNPVSGVAGALIDCSIQATNDAASDMTHLLHADPHGGQKLVTYYTKCGMVQLPANHGPVTPFVRRRRPNEYFHFDHAGADGYSRYYDVFR
jgi:hypothetical protein